MNFPNDDVIHPGLKPEKAMVFLASVRRSPMLSERLEELLNRSERWRKLEQQVTDDQFLDALRIEIAKTEEKIASFSLSGDRSWRR